MERNFQRQIPKPKPNTDMGVYGRKSSFFLSTEEEEDLQLKNIQSILKCDLF